ncbi:hypothetical protein SASPL_126949 [Salvia splendens]|uniref:Lunapark zinc ribbon domain-containing protein n=1 Tax=Salvia splendens TaxID=180675 RepID=A0A8X8XHW5_SALSN|nr:hypothetical protein SASPL_126949 [Salvia splendens]
MAAASKDDVKEPTASTEIKTKTVKKRKGLLSRLWGAIFRLHGDDFEKRHLMLFSLLLEAMALGYAIMTTRALVSDWKMRALLVFPVFLLPALSYITYFTFTRMFDQKDKKMLEKLRAERQAKVDELKERTNYYTTQQLIQRYDTDPAAKAAAATVLAAKLGADSGLKLYMEDDSKQNVSTGKSNGMKVERTNGLRNRKPSRTNTSTKNAITHQMIVEHHTQTGPTNDGGWIARFAALLVGDDPTQSYALICGNCHMHNGLARKEEYPYVTYYCPHCHALSQPKLSGLTTQSTSPTGASSVDTVPNAGGSIGDKVSAVAAADATSGS